MTTKKKTAVKKTKKKSEPIPVIESKYGIEEGEIVLCNITFKVKAKTQIVKDIIFSRSYGKEIDAILKISDRETNITLKRCGIKEDAQIMNIEVIKRLGFKNTENNKYSEIQKSETDERQKNGTFV